jgi:sialic acid synthase SpsE
MTVRIIAEAGENHLGDIDRAAEMVRLAAASGADFIKFQSFDERDLAPHVASDTRAWIRRVQLSEDDHHRLHAEAARQGIAFLSTAVNCRWAAILRDLGCRRVKLASLSLTNQALLEYAGRHFDEVFLSTGMGVVEEIDAALAALGSRTRVTLLHCVSQYPTPDRDASLLTVPYLRERFGCSVGYSDHTIGTVACLAACAIGAELIEKHFTLDKTLEGTDHVLSADPAELAVIAHGCRRIAGMLGRRAKQVAAGEAANRDTMRSLFVDAGGRE